MKILIPIFKNKILLLKFKLENVIKKTQSNRIYINALSYTLVIIKCLTSNNSAELWFFSDIRSEYQLSPYRQEAESIGFYDPSQLLPINIWTKIYMTKL